MSQLLGKIMCIFTQPKTGKGRRMSTPKLWIGTSWKMNKTLQDAQHFAQMLLEAEHIVDPKIQRFVIPSFTCIRDVKAILADTSVLVGAQNMHWNDAGAWTGEISPIMLKDCNMDIVELGHSERRAYFGETNDTVARKSAAAVRHGLVPLICVGETLEQRENGQAQDVLAQQVSSALSAVKDEDASAEILLAYEPVWAIGDGGIPASAEYANERQGEIAKLSKAVLGRPVPCLYGGSVNADNCKELVQCEYIDGLFIGRSAWSAQGYIRILKICSKTVIS